MKLSGKLNRLKSLVFIKPTLDIPYSLDVDLKDVWESIDKKDGSEFFLGVYSPKDLMELLYNVNIVDKLQKMGFLDLEVIVDRRHPFEHRMRLYNGRNFEKCLLMELVVKEGIFQPMQNVVEGFDFEDLIMLMIEWISIQNPRSHFSDNRPRLPGQKYPGLGVLRDLEGVMMQIIKRLNFEGILDIPEHFHGAVMYSPRFSFFNPEMQGRFEAMARDLLTFSLAMASYAVELGCVINRTTGKTEEWSPGEQILPVSKRLRDYFNSDIYREKVQEVKERNSYIVDRSKFEKEFTARTKDDI